MIYLVSVHKRRGPILYPFTCARVVGAAPAAEPSGAEEGSKAARQPEERQAKNTKSRRARWTPSARPLPGRPPQPRQETCQGNMPNTCKAATLEPKSSNTINHFGTNAREAPLWWPADLCEDQEHARLDDN